MEERIKELIRIVLNEFFSEYQIVNKQNTIEVMTKTQLSEYLNVSASWINKNINDIPHIVGVGGIRFRKCDIDQWLDKKSVEVAKYRTIKTKKSNCKYRVE